MARNGRTGQVTALVQQIPKKHEWQRTSKTADKASSTLGKNQALFDAISNVVKSALSDLYNVPKNDPRLIAIIRTIVDYVNGSIKQQLDENTTIEKIVENTENIVDSDKLKSIVEKALKKVAKESIISKEQYEKLSKSISKVVISNLFESKDYEKHKALLEDIKSQLNAASESLNKIVNNKTTTEQKPSKQDKADKSKTDFNKQFASLTKMIQKINGICQSIASKQKDLSKSLNKSVKMLDAAQSTSNKIKDQVKQSAKIQTDVKNITTTGFNQTEKQIKDVNEAVEEVNENVKSISSGGSILGMLGGFGIAFKALAWLGKVFILGPIKFIGKYILGPIVSFVSSVVKGLGKIILAPIKLIGKGINKVIDGIANIATKTFGTFIMSPAGMYTIGYIASFVWTMWLKDLWEKIKAFFEGDTWETIKSAAMTAFDWISTFFTKSWPELKEVIGNITDNVIGFIEQTIAVVNPELYKKIQEYKAKKIDAETDKLLKESNEQKTERVNSAINDANATAVSNILDTSKTVKNVQDNLNEQINDTKVISDTLENLKTPTIVSPGGFSTDQAILLVKGVKSIFNRLRGKTEETLEGDLAVAQAKERKAIAEIGLIPDEFKDKYTTEYLADIANSQDKTLRLLKLQGDIAAEQDAKEKGFTELDEYSDEYLKKWDEELEKQSNKQNSGVSEYNQRQEEIEDAISKQTPKIIAENNVIETNEQQKDDSYFIGSGWQSIDKKWIYGDDGENNSEYARAVKEGTPIVQANTTLSKDQFQKLFTRQQGIKVEDVAFDDLQSALAESKISIGGAADVGSSNQLAKNIATYLAGTQKQIDAMPAEEQRAWQRDLNIKILSLIKAINERQPQQNLMYLQVGQQSLNPTDYDK